MNNLKINDLAQKMRKGNKPAARKIFNYFNPIVLRYLTKRISNPETAEEMAQEIFLKVIKKINQFDENQGNFSAWIWQITKNTLIDFYRQKKIVIVPDLIDEYQNIYFKDSQLEDKLKVEDIIRKIKSLSREEQTIFNLYFISDLSYEEIGEITGKTEGSLRTMIHRINTKLRKNL
jgi:RNA polymerase sigma-70 factor, ECF subfamily